MGLYIDLVSVVIIALTAGISFGLGLFIFNFIASKLRKKSYTEKRGG